MNEDLEELEEFDEDFDAEFDEEVEVEIDPEFAFDVDKMIDEEMRRRNIKIPNPGDAIDEVLQYKASDFESLTLDKLAELMWITSQYALYVRSVQNDTYAKERVLEERYKVLVASLASQMEGKTYKEREAQAKAHLVDLYQELMRVRTLRYKLFQVDRGYYEMLQVLKRYYDYKLREFAAAG